MFEFGSVVVPFYVRNEGMHFFQDELRAFLVDVRDHPAQTLEVPHDEVVQGGSCGLDDHCEKFVIIHQDLYFLAVGNLGLAVLNNSGEPGIEEEYECQIDLERSVFMLFSIEIDKGKHLVHDGVDSFEGLLLLVDSVL